jgi:hypothetical protein
MAHNTLQTIFYVVPRAPEVKKQEATLTPELWIRIWIRTFLGLPDPDT